MTRNSWLTLISVVVFALGVAITLIVDNPDPKLITALLFGGFAAFAAGHLP